MNEQELRRYAAGLILDHAQDIEYLSIHECAEDFTGEEISEEDARKVSALISRAIVTVRFP